MSTATATATATAAEATATAAEATAAEATAAEATATAAEATMKDVLNVSATGAPTDPPPAEEQRTRVETITPSADPNTLEFVRINADLGALIAEQHGTMIRWFAARGDLVLEGLGVKFRKCTTGAQRVLARSNAIKAMEATARVYLDPDVEPQPKLDRWIAHSIVLAFEPAAARLKSATACDVVATLWTRVDPPVSWDASEEYALKPGLDKDTVRAFIVKAVKEQWTSADVKAMLDTLWGASETAQAVKIARIDPVKAARSLAESIMDRIREQKIDPETLFDELQAQLTRYGWALAKGRDAKGVETLKPFRMARQAK